MERYEAAVRLMPHSIRDWLNQLLVALHLRDPPAKPQDFPYLESILAFAGFVFVLHTYLDFRQLKAIRKPRPPPVLKDHYDEADYQKTQAYNIDKWYFGQAQGIVGTVISLAWIAFLWMPWLWDRSADLVHRYGYAGEVKVTIVFCILDSLKDLVLGLPWGLYGTFVIEQRHFGKQTLGLWLTGLLQHTVKSKHAPSLYGTFVIEQRHGFNKQTLGLWLTDLVKQLALGAVILPPCVAAFTLILQHTSAAMVLYLWAFVFGLQLFFMTVYPTLIAPLFNKFDPLPKGQLRDHIEALAGSLKFPLQKLYVIDGSKRSDHSNAYMYGFGKNKRIVLFDTLVEQCSQEEVVAVLAHELGHWKLGHTKRNLIMVQVVLFLQFALFGLIRTSPGLFRSFGFVHAQPAFIAFTLFQLIIGPLDEVLGLVTNIISRTYEFQADHFAVGLGHARPLAAALKVLDKKNRSATNVDAWYSAFHHSHPPLVQRLEAIDSSGKKAQ